MKFLLCLFFWGCLYAQAQPDSLLLTKNFKFNDGVYMQFADFQKNKPTFTWAELNARMVTSDEGFVAQVEYLKNDLQVIDLQKVWGICIEGIPYIQLKETQKENRAARFASLRVRGKICYFSFPKEVTEMVEIKAYNPLNGRPYRSSRIPVEKIEIQEQMLDFQTGEIAAFTKENFMQWIADDPQLWNTVKDLSPSETEEKLFKCLLIYVDRNNVYLR